MMVSWIRTGLDFIPMRYLLTILGFLLTFVASTTKYAIGIAITEMVSVKVNFNNISFNDPNACPMQFTDQIIDQFEEGEFDWDERTQGLIFSALYWSYVTMQIPFGLLVERFGPRYILIFSVFLSTSSYLLTPLVTVNLGSNGLIVTRFIMGFGLAAIYPSINILLSHWAPPLERSKLGGLIFVGENIGIIMSMALSGLILGNSKGNWPLLFYVYGSFGVVWLILWYFLGYDSPSVHPHISNKEKKYLENVLNHNSRKKVLFTPWKEMVTSLPLWATLLAQIGHDWGMITIVTELPKYMKSVLHFEIEANGYLSAFPYLSMTIIAILSGWFSDFLLEKKYFSITVVRKIFTTVAAVGPAIGILGASFSGCNQILVTIMFTLGMGCMGFFYPSLGVNTLDLSPNYSGTLMGVIAYGSVGGILSPYLVGVLAPDSTMMQWRLVFWIAVAFLIISNIIYLFFGSGEVQSWNEPDSQKNIKRNGQKEEIQDTQMGV
uniref:Major facilitator superfamily (MFS) profile domain-containing protein n=2 Tax=Clastoptera arizonana TaxID=38151 RepID=A0A1B6BXP3_9HEMI